MNRIAPIKPPTGQTAETRSAIEAVIHAETRNFLASDYEGWSACWVKDERTQDVYVSQVTGLNVLSGWDAVSANMRHVFANGLTCRKSEIAQNDLQISVEGNTAWVVFEGRMRGEDGELNVNFETRILERQSDGWKIAYSSVMDRHEQATNKDEISVDGKGRVLWASEDNLAKLKDHPILTVSAGRIRARRLDWDKALQRHIQRAGAFHGFFELHRFATETGGALRYPAVLGDTPDGGVAVVQISARDGVTYLRIDGDGLIDHRLAVAQVIFGLSDGQMRIASRIAAGDGLKQAAQTAGISINTARTHLARIYEKTGVNSQTALVRLLLSVG